MLSGEKRAFFYQTLRFNRRAGIESRKLYKVYEVRQIGDYTPALAEIYKTVGNFGGRRDILNISRYCKLAERNGALWYPVLCSMDIDGRGKINIDSYFSIR